MSKHQMKVEAHKYCLTGSEMNEIAGKVVAPSRETCRESLFRSLLA